MPPPPPSPGRRLRKLLFGLLLAYVGLSLLGGAGFVAKEAIRRPRPVKTRASHLAPRAERIEFRTRDGYRISGYLAPPVGQAPMLIIQHGRGRNRDSYLPWARVFAGAGYGVMAFDWRAHGMSEGWVIQHGGGEPEDLLAALAFLESRPDTRGRLVGLFGASMGAANVAMTGDRLPPRVRCMVLDSPYGNLARMADGRLSKLGVLSVGPRLVLDGVAIGLFGATPAAIAPEERLKGFAPRPVLVIHGVDDRTIPVSEGRSLHAVYPGAKQYWETPEPGHCAARTDRTREWMGRLAGFYAAHLPGAPPEQAVLALTPERLEKGQWIELEPAP